uniref:UDENN domain-containing protein n=1 Tax=Trypanosoma congolense (strain IL3000) TaxID=1068625 RepID=G0UWN4_TRYCI|nr:conserved hypothetical protein [Trypanosoma congolense IL3000]
MPNSQWVLCFASIRFDIDIGPVVEHVVPPDALTDEGKRLLTQVGFPDCNPECGHDLIFYFHMKSLSVVNPNGSSEEIDKISSTCTTEITSDVLLSSSATNIYGSTYFRQKNDASVPRGYVQQAFVLLSYLPYLTAHDIMLRILALRLCQCCPLSPDTEKRTVLSALSPVPSAPFEMDLSFDAERYSQKDILERALEEIEDWPTPHPHVQYDLTLLRQPFSFVTVTRRLQALDAQSSFGCMRRAMRVDERVTFLGDKRQSVGEYNILPLYALLNEHLSNLTRIWELILSHEPLFIWSNTPSMASGVAVAVVSLIEPIVYNGTLRPYLTVQDKTFTQLSQKGKTKPFTPGESIIVASTNPFFSRAFEGWGNQLTVMDRCARSSGSAKVKNVEDNHDTAGSNTEPCSTGCSPRGSPRGNCGTPGSPSASDGGGRGVASSPRFPLIFTYESFQPALTAAKKASTGFPMLPFRQNSATLPSSRGVGTFVSPFHFLVDHRTLTAALLKRLEQASRLSEEAQLALLNMNMWDSSGGLEGTPASGAVVCDESDGGMPAGMGANSPQKLFQRNIADDVTRKFFVTLTQEFLLPVCAWFQTTTSGFSLFHLCNPTVCVALSPQSFLLYLKDNRDGVPSFLSHSPYKTYSAMYERFATGSLFRSYILKLVDRRIRQELKELQLDVWAAEHTEEERVETIGSLMKLVEKEVKNSLDPDVVFVTSAISLLVGMATYVGEPLRDELIIAINNLKP